MSGGIQAGAPQVHYCTWGTRYKIIDVGGLNGERCMQDVALLPGPLAAPEYPVTGGVEGGSQYPDLAAPYSYAGERYSNEIIIGRLSYAVSGDPPAMWTPNHFAAVSHIGQFADFSSRQSVGAWDGDVPMGSTASVSGHAAETGPDGGLVAGSLFEYSPAGWDGSVPPAGRVGIGWARSGYDFDGTYWLFAYDVSGWDVHVGQEWEETVSGYLIVYHYADVASSDGTVYPPTGGGGDTDPTGALTVSLHAYGPGWMLRGRTAGTECVVERRPGIGRPWMEIARWTGVGPSVTTDAHGAIQAAYTSGTSIKLRDVYAGTEATVATGSRAFTRWSPGHVLQAVAYWNGGSIYVQVRDGYGSVIRTVAVVTAPQQTAPQQTAALDWRADGAMELAYSDGTNTQSKTSTDSGASWN